jgi:hypothetical protein
MGTHFEFNDLAELTKASPPATVLPSKEMRKRIVDSFSKDLVNEDACFQYVLTNCGFPLKEQKPLSLYFGGLVTKYVDGKDQLSRIKQAFYELMKPVALMHYLCDNYEKEEERYKTSDGKAGKNDSAHFFLNTMVDLLKKVDLEKSTKIHISQNNYMYVFDDDKDDKASEALPLDAVRIYYYAEFNQRMYSLLQKSTTLGMSKETFVSGFNAYLAKKLGKDSTKDSTKDSLLTFLIKNPPVSIPNSPAKST